MCQITEPKKIVRQEFKEILKVNTKIMKEAKCNKITFQTD